MSTIDKRSTYHALNLLALLHNTLTRGLDECMLIESKYGDVGGEVTATGLVLAARADAVRQVIDSITAKRDGKLDFRGVVQPESDERWVREGEPKEALQG